MSVARYFNPKLKPRIIAGNEPDWLRRHSRRAYIVRCVLSAPDWVDRRELAMLRAWTKVMTAFTGKLHVLDHEIPLQHPLVCGLTVPWNMRVVTYATNANKGGKCHEWQHELFNQNGALI